MGVSLFLCGDVMTGRGIDQALPFPVYPQIYEPYITDSRVYLDLAEQLNGSIHTPLPFTYIWGDSLEELNKRGVDFRLINLETSITTNQNYWEGKGINYRMNPKNISCLSVAKINFCALANNHVLDWGYTGLSETLQTLDSVAIKHAGADSDTDNACKPSILHTDCGRLLVYSFASFTSGVPAEWEAQSGKPGVAVIDEYSPSQVAWIKNLVLKSKKKEDIVIFSVHWGENWGYTIPVSQIRFAHALIDEAFVDIVWGHSSHHVKPFEIYKNKIVLYGCGDFINDYEGIGGNKEYRGDLSLMYFVYLGNDGSLQDLIMTPMQIRNFSLKRAVSEDIQFLHQKLNELGKEFHTTIKIQGKSLMLKF